MTVEIQVGKSSYKISCQEAEKERIQSAAESINDKLNQLAKNLKISDEKMLLVMIALELEEELRSIREDKFSEEELFNSISDNIDNITSYINKLTHKIQNL
jgi:cell division protein ZapA (FtsZ GTPase activity inhibitor)